jgi:hypothetical protein
MQQNRCEGGKNVNGFGVEATAAFRRFTIQRETP